MNNREATKRFYALIWPHRAAVLRVAQILTASVHEAEDLSQEVMIKAFNHLDSLDPDSDAKKWLMTILRNARIDRLRASPNLKEVSLEHLAAEAAVTNSDNDGSQWSEPRELLEQLSDHEVIQALRELDEDVRWTLLLVDVQGLDQQTAAAILEVPVGTIKSRAHRGRALLRQALLPFAKERRLIRER